MSTSPPPPPPPPRPCPHCGSPLGVATSATCPHCGRLLQAVRSPPPPPPPAPRATEEPEEWIATPSAIAEGSELEVVPEIAPIAPRSKREKPTSEPVRQRVADAEVLKLSPEEKAKLRVKMRIAIAVFSAVALLITFIVLLMLSP